MILLTHFYWSFPLYKRSSVHDTLISFFAYVRMQFQPPVVSLQADNGTEFLNSPSLEFFHRHGIHLRLSCPYTSQQNGKAEWAICTVNNTMLTLLFQAHMPPSFRVEALATTTYLLNCRPSTTIQNSTPALLLSTISVSSDACAIPTLIPSVPINLALVRWPIFFSYPSSHKGYRLYEIGTHHVHICSHVIFVEDVFPFPQT